VIRAIRQQETRFSVMLVALLVLCVLGRPLLAVACDLHDVTHHDAAELVQLPAAGDTLQDSDGDSLLHDLLHVAHYCGSAIALPSSSLSVLGRVADAGIPPGVLSGFHGSRIPPVFRPPISV
jgi:hypothetical protein